MRNVWRDLERQPGGVEGARRQFERACELIVAKMRPGERVWQVRENPGDHGIDVGVGDITQPIDIYQVKYLPGPMTDSRWASIRKSYKTAASDKVHVLNRWYLVLPEDLDHEYRARFDSFRHEPGMQPIEVVSPEALLAVAYDCGLTDAIFDNKTEQKLDALIAMQQAAARPAAVSQPTPEARAGRLALELSGLVADGWADMSDRMRERVHAAEKGDVDSACAFLMSVLKQPDPHVEERRRDCLFSAHGVSGFAALGLVRVYRLAFEQASAAGRAADLEGIPVWALSKLILDGANRWRRRAAGWPDSEV